MRDILSLAAGFEGLVISTERNFTFVGGEIKERKRGYSMGV